jgi:hypothetical protein
MAVGRWYSVVFLRVLGVFLLGRRLRILSRRLSDLGVTKARILQREPRIAKVSDETAVCRAALLLFGHHPQHSPLTPKGVPVAEGAGSS